MGATKNSIDSAFLERMFLYGSLQQGAARTCTCAHQDTSSKYNQYPSVTHALAVGGDTVEEGPVFILCEFFFPLLNVLHHHFADVVRVNTMSHIIRRSLPRLLRHGLLGVQDLMPCVVDLPTAPHLNRACSIIKATPPARHTSSDTTAHDVLPESTVHDVPSETFTNETGAQTFARVADKVQGELLMKLHTGLQHVPNTSVEMRGTTMVVVHKGQPLLRVERCTGECVLVLHTQHDTMRFSHQVVHGLNTASKCSTAYRVCSSIVYPCSVCRRMGAGPPQRAPRSCRMLCSKWCCMLLVCVWTWILTTMCTTWLTRAVGQHVDHGVDQEHGS